MKDIFHSLNSLKFVKNLSVKRCKGKYYDGNMLIKQVTDSFLLKTSCFPNITIHEKFKFGKKCLWINQILLNCFIIIETRIPLTRMCAYILQPCAIVARFFYKGLKVTAKNPKLSQNVSQEN